MKKLFPIQAYSKDVLLEALRKHGSALDSSAVGTGKTLKAVEISREFGQPVFVVCPKIVIPTWEKAFAEQGLPVPTVINYEKLRTGNTNLVSKKHKKVFTWDLPPNSLVIWDEVHKCKGPRSINAALLMTARQQGHSCLMLSATAGKNPGDLCAIGYCLGLHDGRNFTTWALKHGSTFNPWRQLTFPVKNRPRLKALHAQIYPDRGHIVSREDMKEFFSETSIIVDPLDLGDDGEIARLYEQMEDELAELDRISGSDRGASALTTRLRARQAVEMLKVSAIVTMIEEYLEDGLSVAVFLNFSATIQAVADRVGVDVARIEGVSSALDKKLREEAIEDFQSNKVRVALVNIAAGGTGLSLHDTHGDYPRVAIIAPNDSAEDIAQVVGRVDRAGSKSDTIQRIIFAAGTVEEEVARNFRRKLVDMGILHAPLENNFAAAQ